jgi:polyhydroxyalkanoate synthase
MAYPAPFDAAPQHGPRPLPLFLELLRSETAASPPRAAAAMKGLKAYQDAPRPPRDAPMPVVATAGRACLRDYGASGLPVVFAPSLINPPFVLDLAPHNSLLRWMAGQGVRPLLLDWGAPRAEERDLDIAGHVETLMVPLLDALGERAALVGYCLGGTMAVAAAALRPLAGLALIATPWRFSGFPEDARADMTRLWETAKPTCEALGYMPMEILQSAFWRLDPGRTVSKYERFGALNPESEQARAFVALEDWANGGAPLTLGAGREAFEDLFAADLPGTGRWSVGGRTIDPAALSCPLLDIVSLSDRIVPAATATGLTERRELGSGHVGMVVGGRARTQLWEPLAAWLSQLHHS